MKITWSNELKIKYKVFHESSIKREILSIIYIIMDELIGFNETSIFFKV